MAVGEELEAALQRGWSFDELEVYADHLLAKNDPRGDIVALDLSPRPEQATWVQRRRSALGSWLGNMLAARAGHLVQHGFLHDLRDGMFPRELLDSPAGTFLRGYTTWGRTRVADSLERLAKKQRPWLSRLTIAHYGAKPIAPAIVHALIAATPRLEEVTIVGNVPFDAFPHPAVKRARLGTRCYGIEIEAPKTRIDVPEDCPAARISDDDLDLLMDLVELAPDCNQLYTHAQQFDEPLPALITRLAAAKLVDLDGPLVRVASPDMFVGAAWKRVALPELSNANGWLHFERMPDIFLQLRSHGAFLRACLEQLPVSARVHDVLVEYHNLWTRMVQGHSLGVDRVARLREALNALLELRTLFVLDLGNMERGNADRWIEIEQLVAALDTDGDVQLNRPYYWYG
jgi:hypothetical protein